MTRSESQAATRRELCDTAERLFERQGFHRTSVAEIAAEAGYTTGAIYSNFPRKEDLAVAVLDRNLQTNIESLVSQLARHDDLAGRLLAVIGWRRDLLHEPEPLGVLRLELWLYSANDPDLRATLVDGQRQLHRAFARLLEQQAADLGSELVVSADLLAGSLLALGDGTAVAEGLDPEGAHAQAFAWSLATLLVGSLDPNPIPAAEWPGFLDLLLGEAASDIGGRTSSGG